MKIRQAEMEKEIISQLCNDELIRFIANRHKIEPETLITGFLTGDCHVPSILLENEREILRGLMNENTRRYEKI